MTWVNGPHEVPGFLEVVTDLATQFHLQSTVSPELQAELADFMIQIVFAQIVDNVAGRLDADGARGGPVHLAQQEFFEGINSGADFDPNVFDIYDAWLGSSGSRRDNQRGAIARGQEVFNTKTFGGGATCGSCHNAPNVGSSSIFRMIDIGTADPRPELEHILPVITLRNLTTGELRAVTELGRAEVTGAWSDVGRFRVPPLRGLAARAPYFHDGRAATLKDVIKHYEDRFDIEFTNTERKDLETFLGAL